MEVEVKILFLRGRRRRVERAGRGELRWWFVFVIVVLGCWRKDGRVAGMAGRANGDGRTSRIRHEGQRRGLRFVVSVVTKGRGWE